MGQPLEVHIRELQEFYWSSADPDGLGFVQLADALRRAGDLVEARRVLREGLGRHPDYLSGHVVAAWLSQDQGNSQEAEAQFRTSLELDPRNLCALRGLAEIFLAREDLGPALEFMEALLQEDPLDLDLPDRISELRSRLGEPQRIDSAPAAEPPPVVWDDPDAVAEELNWEMAALQPDSSPEPVREEAIRAAPEVPGLGEEPSAYPEAGDLGEYSGFLRDEVVEDGEPIPSMDDLDGALVTATLGEVYLRQGWLDRAEGVFLTLLREDPSNEQAKRRLLDVRELMGETGIWAVKSKAEETPTPSIVPIASLAPQEDREAEAQTELQVDPGLVGFPEPAVVVPIEALAPDRVRSGARAETEAEEVIAIEALAPEYVLPIEALAPEDVLPIEALAPEDVLPIEALAPEDVLPIEALAPEDVLPIEALAPEDVLPIEALAPEEVIPVEALAPDGTPDGHLEESAADQDPSLDAFERWLENLQ